MCESVVLHVGSARWRAVMQPGEWQHCGGLDAHSSGRESVGGCPWGRLACMCLARAQEHPLHQFYVVEYAPAQTGGGMFASHELVARRTSACVCRHWVKLRLQVRLLTKVLASTRTAVLINIWNWWRVHMCRRWMGVVQQSVQWICMCSQACFKVVALLWAVLCFAYPADFSHSLHTVVQWCHFDGQQLSMREGTTGTTLHHVHVARSGGVKALRNACMLSNMDDF